MKMLPAMIVLTAANLLVGCADHKENMRTTGPDVTPNYSGSHYNPGVNSDGALTDRNDPAIKPSSASANGATVGRTGTSVNGGTSAGTSVGGGTSSENGGSSAPTGTAR